MPESGRRTGVSARCWRRCIATPMRFASVRGAGACAGGGERRALAVVVREYVTVRPGEAEGARGRASPSISTTRPRTTSSADLPAGRTGGGRARRAHRGVAARLVA
jgi:hypothetical protein